MEIDKIPTPIKGKLEPTAGTEQPMASLYKYSANKYGKTRRNSHKILLMFQYRNVRRA